MHDYNIHGMNKQTTYYILSLLSFVIVAPFSNCIHDLSTKVNIPLTITISSATIFSFLYFLFNRYIWRIPFLGIPNLNGDWKCTGKSFKYNENIERNWSGTLHIRQTWKHILITLDTESSKSTSISLSGSIIKLDGLGLKLHYLYSNQPKPDHKELHSHLGHCEIIFKEDFDKGNGSYFTNKERLSYGSMTFERIK